MLIPRALGTLAAQGYEGAGELTFYKSVIEVPPMLRGLLRGQRPKVLETRGGWRLGVRTLETAPGETSQLHLLLVSDGTLAQTFDLVLEGDGLFSASVDESQRLTPHSLGPEAVSVALTGLKRLIG